MRDWVDVLTGVILKQQTFGEGGGSMVGEYVITGWIMIFEPCRMYYSA